MRPVKIPIRLCERWVHMSEGTFSVFVAHLNPLNYLMIPFLLTWVDRFVNAYRYHIMSDIKSVSSTSLKSSLNTSVIRALLSKN